MVTPLSPSFKLTAEEALALVLPTTQRVKTSTSMDSSAAVEVNALSLGDGEGGEGEPQRPTPDSANADAEALLALEHLTDALENDPFLTYSAATALYQEVEMLERYVQAATMRRGHVPYLLRMQVAVEPYHAHASWDAYVDVEITTSDAKPVEVVPLVASLNMESSASSIANRQMWSLAFGLQVLGSAVGIDAAKRRQIERSLSRLGMDLNSVSVVSQGKKPGTVSIKLGARNAGKRQRRQASQIHSIAVLVLVPTNDASAPGARADAVRGQPEIRELKVKTGEPYARDVGTGMRVALENGGPGETIVALPPYSGAYVAGCEANAGATEDDTYKCKLAQHITITTNDKQMIAVVPGIQDADAAEMTAVLVVNKNAAGDGNPRIDIRANGVTVDATRRLATFSFPAFSTYLPGAIQDYKYQLYVYHRGETWWSGQAQNSFPLLLTDVTIVKELEPPKPQAVKPTPKPALVMSVDTKVIQRDGKGHGGVALKFTEPSKPVSGLAPLELRISGASVESVPNGVLEEDASGRIVVKKAGRVVLPLINITGTVQIGTYELQADNQGLAHDGPELSVNPM
jgi:hypothetical protein